jgi:putative ABC transport system permease protein
MAAIGLYGVISYSVAQRLREVGIRSALGANRRDIVTLVLREGAFVTVLGAVPGFGLSLLALRLTSNLVGPVPTTDMVTFGSVPVVIAAVILLACYLPARRAARVDPMVVLRGL